MPFPTTARAVGLALAMGLAAVPLADCAAMEQTPHASLAARLTDPRPLVVAHRGCWRSPAENALAGLRACIDLGIDMVEIDLRRTQDGVIVLLHDATLDRTTSLTGPLAQTPYATLAKARLKRGLGGPDAPFTKEAPPTFEQVLEASKGRIFLFLDIKDPIHAEVAELVRKHGAEQQVLFSVNAAFGPKVLTRALVGDSVLMPKFDQYSGSVCAPDLDPSGQAATYADLQTPIYEAVFCDDAFLKRVRARAGDAGLWVNALGPRFMAGRDEAVALRDPDAVWGALLNLGVTAIQTDHPAELSAYLRKTGRR